MVRKLQDATRNRGQVHLMRDHSNGSCLVAVKQMPNRWIMTNHLEFVREHPTETEMPWQDVGCVRFLNGVGFPFSCGLLGVYRDEAYTYVVTTFASEGDLFLWCEDSVPPGKEREVVVRPLARQIVEGVQQLHDLSIVHRDLSLENILLSKDDDGELKVRIIDFSMASLTRRLRSSVRGKASYQAPELHSDQEYDAFLTDAFSVGVTLYAMLVKDYPWLSTRPGGCKCFEYVRKHGFRAYLDKRKLRNSTAKVADIMSEPLKQLLEGLLNFDPAMRLTLGEHDWENGRRRSVWDVAWLHTGPGEG
jgi:serine/threonine protein kinase